MRALFHFVHFPIGVSVNLCELHLFVLLLHRDLLPNRSSAQRSASKQTCFYTETYTFIEIYCILIDTHTIAMHDNKQTHVWEESVSCKRSYKYFLPDERRHPAHHRLVWWNPILWPHWTICICLSFAPQHSPCPL